MRHAPVVASVVTLLAFALACGGATDKLQEEAEKQAVSAASGGSVKVGDDQHITIKGNDGSTVAIGSGAEVPADFPKEIPMYPGAKVTASVSGAGAAGASSGSLVSFETTDKPQQVFDYYKGKVGAPYQKQAEADLGNGSYMLTFTTADNKKTLGVMIAADDSSKKTTFSLTSGTN